LSFPEDIVLFGALLVETAANFDGARRRFGLGDGLILVGALAVSLERFRAFRSIPQHVVWCWEAVAQLTGWSSWRWSLGRQQVIASLKGQVIVLGMELLCPVLLGLMVAQPLLRLRRPRPPFGQVVRQSGFVTCLMGIVVVATILPMGELWFSLMALSLWSTRVIILLMIWPLCALAPWRAEASWIDRLGRAVGWGWIAALAAGTLLGFLGWA
jgi:hypothetical protein